MGDEIAWLIETEIDGVFCYFGKTVEGVGFTMENLDAVRFARKCDAEIMIDELTSKGDSRHMQAVEHMWS